MRESELSCQFFKKMWKLRSQIAFNCQQNGNVSIRLPFKAQKAKSIQKKAQDFFNEKFTRKCPNTQRVPSMLRQRFEKLDIAQYYRTSTSSLVERNLRRI